MLEQAKLLFKWLAGYLAFVLAIATLNIFFAPKSLVWAGLEVVLFSFFAIMYFRWMFRTLGLRAGTWWGTATVFAMQGCILSGSWMMARGTQALARHLHLARGEHWGIGYLLTCSASFLLSFGVAAWLMHREMQDAMKEKEIARDEKAVRDAIRQGQIRPAREHAKPN